MKTAYQKLNQLIKQEADKILYEKGLINTLSTFGAPHIHGSYLLDLMTWRDLDIYLQVDDISIARFFLLGKRVCESLAPVKMSFRNELKAQTKGLPSGLYWGIYLGNERADAWKIDIWVVETAEYVRLSKYCADIKQMLSPAKASRILKIKSQCWQDPEYRKSYSSADLYKAVLENNVTTIEEFKKYLKQEK